MSRRNEEARDVVKALLESKPECRELSQHELSRRTGVSRAVVAEVLEEMGIPRGVVVIYQRGGRTQTMHAGKIGHRPRDAKLAVALSKLRRTLAEYRQFPELKPIREAVRQVRAETRKRRKKGD